MGGGLRWLAGCPEPPAEPPAKAASSACPKDTGGSLCQGSSFKNEYYKDAQQIFSRVQHHFHEKTNKGYRPLAACRSARLKDRCKHDFPMDQRVAKMLRVI